MFTGAQLFTRAFVNACLVVAGIAAVEEAPEGARAFATAMFALALGVGIALGVIFLPFADLGNYGWRISFLVERRRAVLPARSSAGSCGRRGATRRSSGSRCSAVGSARCSRPSYRARFLLLGLVAFITNVFIAPSSQLTNRYLTRAHDFSNSDVAGFRTVTAGLPGLIGVLLAGRLAESRGRRPVAIVGLLVATALPDGVLRRERRRAALDRADDRDRRRGVRRARARHARRRAVPHRDTRHVERLPARRGRCRLGDRASWSRRSSATSMGGLGPAIAVCGIPTLIAAVLLVPRLPETVVPHASTT